MALIDFVPTDWNPGTAPGISADQLDRIEAGINDLNLGLWTGDLFTSGVIALDGSPLKLGDTGGGFGSPDLRWDDSLGSMGLVVTNTDEFSLAAGGVDVARVGATGLRGVQQFLAAGSGVDEPGYSFAAELGLGVFRSAAGVVGLASGGEEIAGFTSVSTYRVPNNPNTVGGQDIPGIDLARIEYSQAAFAASVTTFSTRSSSILASQLNPHFRLASADSNTNPDKRIAIADDFFGSAAGSEVSAALSGGWWNFHRAVSTLDIKVSVFPWNPALAMPAVVPGPKQAGGAGATPFSPYDLLALTPVTFELTADHITAREVDPGEILGYIAEDLADVAPWLLDEGGGAMSRDAYRVAVIEILRDLNDRVVTLEP